MTFNRWPAIAQVIAITVIFTASLSMMAVLPGIELGYFAVIGVITGLVMSAIYLKIWKKQPNR
jgi:hypothetical protein